MSMDDLKNSNFFKFSLANMIQLVLMAAMLLNWWGSHESNSASTTAIQAVIIQQQGDRITKLEEANKQFFVGLSDLQSKVNVLVAIAEEQRKKQK
jgi:hypothetical protein